MENAILMKLDVPIPCVGRFTVTAMCSGTAAGDIRKRFNGLEYAPDSRSMHPSCGGDVVHLDAGYRYVPNVSNVFFPDFDRLATVLSIVPYREQHVDNLGDRNRMEGLKAKVTRQAFRGYYCHVKIESAMDTRLLTN